MRQQHLGGAKPVLAQLGLIHLGQAHLSHRCGGLQFVQGVGALLPSQALHAFSNRAAGDHDEFATLTHQRAQLTAPFAYGLLVQTTAFVGHQTRADLDHNASCILQDRAVVLVHE